MSGVWTPCKPVSKLNQDTFSESSHRRCRKEDGLEVAVHQQDEDSNAFAEEYESNGCIRTFTMTNVTPSEDRAQLGVVRRTIAARASQRSEKNKHILNMYKNREQELQSDNR